jgi:hypothetical protein
MYLKELVKYYVKAFILYKVIASIFQALHLVKRPSFRFFKLPFLLTSAKLAKNGQQDEGKWMP